jgi:carboxypeptidase Taq
MSSYQSLLDRYSEINALQKAVALMSWDQQVLMPSGGAKARAEHIASLSRIAHEKLVADETQTLLEKSHCEVEPGTPEEDTLRVLRRTLSIQTKLPTALVEEKTRITSAAYDNWKIARAESDFKRLQPYLERLFEIAGETAELLGYEEHIYDPLIDLFEEGATHDDARRMFEQIKEPIKELVQATPFCNVDDHGLISDWDQSKLLDFTRGATAQIGFDMHRGRLDLAPNAFCTNFSMADVRMTTRPKQHINGVIFSSFHEMGHGLYEQGSPQEWDRTPLAGGISLGVHESQSRLWENIVGRSKPFWTFFLPQLQARLPQLAGFSVDSFYRAINKVQPGPVRIGSDEMTYNLHILLRFELETEVLTGKVQVKDLPEAWNEKMRDLLGIVPENDGLGVLQDVHWSRGSVGYFPTYTMGNLIGWQVWERLGEELEVEELMSTGHFRPILEWLQERIYSKAKRLVPKELLQEVLGGPMEPEGYLRGMERKFASL